MFMILLGLQTQTIYMILKNTESGVDLHFFYKPTVNVDDWKKLQDDSVKLMKYFEESIGPYPWKQYSIIQGGDGGMEYAMCTMITGERPYPSLLGVTAHEMAHAWFQHLLATNEAKARLDGRRFYRIRYFTF